MTVYAETDVEIPDWAANMKTLHAWVEHRPVRGRFAGRRMGYKALCGVTTRYDFDWALAITEQDALRTAYHFNHGKPVCAECRAAAAEIVAARISKEPGDG
jgi:hypothetical protein